MSSEAMMPIPTDALSYRTMLFDLSKPVTLSTELFDEIWSYIDSFYIDSTEVTIERLDDYTYI